MPHEDPSADVPPPPTPHDRGAFYVLRISSLAKWEEPESLERHPFDNVLGEFCLRPSETGLSFYVVSDLTELGEVAALFSLSLRDSPRHFDCAIIPASELREFGLHHVPIPEHSEYLSDRHYEIPIASSEMEHQIAERFWSSRNLILARLRTQLLVQLALKSSWLGEVDISPKWRTMVAKAQSQPQ